MQWAKTNKTKEVEWPIDEGGCRRRHKGVHLENGRPVYRRRVANNKKKKEIGDVRIDR